MRKKQEYARKEREIQIEIKKKKRFLFEKKSKNWGNFFVLQLM